MTKKLILFLFISIFVSNLSAQSNLKVQIPKKKRYAAFEVLNEKFGIRVYDNLNLRLGGDSVRNDCKGYACTGWVIDYYNDGSILHKGYYDEGKLTIFKNFFPNSQLERDYRTVDDIRSILTQYYASGMKKSFVKYKREDPIIWEDYYENGNLEYREEFHKSFEYYIEQTSYFENGKVESTLLLENKKKLQFSKKEFHENGQLKYEGEIVYDRNMLDYLKKGKWMTFNSSGQPVKEEVFANGVLDKEKSLN